MAKSRPSRRRNLPARTVPRTPAPASDRLLGDIRQLIDAAREQTASAVNSALVRLYWHIGKRIREDVLGERRAEYGEEILQTLSAKLVAEYGRGFSEKSLRHMMRFAEVFPSEEPVKRLSPHRGDN